MTRASMRAVTGGGADPPNLIMLNFETFTAEFGGQDYVTGGADLNGASPGDGGGMFRAASPRAAAVGAGPEYLSFFYSHNATASPIPNAARWKAQVDLFNRTDLDGGAASGQDTIAVDSLRVDRIYSAILPR
jgi:hypothetical protein